MNILAIFDNGGETLDRYTVVLDQEGDGLNSHECLGLSEGGDGFSQFSYCTYEQDSTSDWLGKQVDYSDLSTPTAIHIAQRLTGAL